MIRIEHLIATTRDRFKSCLLGEGLDVVKILSLPNGTNCGRPANSSRGGQQYVMHQNKK